MTLEKFTAKTLRELDRLDSVAPLSPGELATVARFHAAETHPADCALIISRDRDILQRGLQQLVRRHG